MSALLPFGLFILFLLAIMCLIGGAIWYSVRQREKRQAIWAGVAHSLGLSYRDDWIQGVHEGQQVDARIVVRGSGKNQSTWTVVRSKLQPELDLGMQVYRAGALSALGSVLGMQDIPTGDRAFDDAFVIKGDEPQRVVALLRPELKQFLMSESTGDMVLSDSGAVIERRGAISDAPTMKYMLQAVSHACALAQRLGEYVPPSAALVPHYHAMSQLAAAEGLELRVMPLQMWGRLANCEVHVVAARSGPMEYSLTARAVFPLPLAIGLAISPEGALDKFAKMFGAGDIAMGDRVFDDYFKVQCMVPDMLPRLIDAPVRGRILQALPYLTSFEISDREVRAVIPASAQDPQAVPRLLAHLTTLVQEISARVPSAPGGPYRR